MRILSNHRGIALLLTVTVITLLVAASLELNRKVRATVTTTAVNRDRMVLREMAVSGVHGAMALLIKDKMETPADSIQEDWANPEKVAALVAEMPFPRGNLTVSITDELGRLQVNALVTDSGGRVFNEAQRQGWERYLRWLLATDETFEDIDPVVIVNSLKDWMDSGDDEAITGLSGAESEYYEDLDPPYAPRNGPVKYLGDLVRVKGITPDLYFGIGETPGLSDHVTIYGVLDPARIGDKNNPFQSGKININTAPLPVLVSLMPEGDEAIAQAIFEYRQEMEEDRYVHDLSGPTWYKDVPGLSEFEIPAELLTTASDIFRIRSGASFQELSETLVVMVRRMQRKKSGKWECRVLSWVSE
jgi:general secretion pathway protein K